MPAFILERTFSASPERLWEAWTDPEIFRDWYGPMPDPCDVQEMDVREGGAYRVAMGGHVDEGVYHAVQASTHLRMGGAQGTMDMRFSEEADGTRLVLRMDDLPEAHHDAVRGAWAAAFGKLDSLLGA